jgi:hypothetical protein
MWAPLVIMSMGLAAEPANGPICEPILPVDVDGRYYYNRRAELPPDGPWCLLMRTPGTGPIDIRLVPFGKIPTSWTLRVWTNTG